MGTHVVLGLHKASQKADGLDGLAQPHLICQDAIHVVVVQGHQELEAPQLVGAQCAAHKHVRCFYLQGPHGLWLLASYTHACVGQADALLVLSGTDR